MYVASYIKEASTAETGGGDAYHFGHRVIKRVGQDASESDKVCTSNGLPRPTSTSPIGAKHKKRLNEMKITTCQELIDKYREDPNSISFVQAATGAFLLKVDANYLDEIPQYVMELEK